MSKKPCVFIDTNILVRVASQGKVGCSWDDWLSLTKRTTDRKIELLTPEVVLLEFRKKLKEIPDEIERKNGIVKGEIEKGLQSEIHDLKARLITQINDAEKERVKEYRERWPRIDSFLRSDSTVLPFDADIWARIERKKMVGEFPDRFKEQRKSFDLYSLECLVRHFEKREADKYELLICTENFDDFGVKTDKGTSAHAEFRQYLPTTTLYQDLESLLAVIDGRLAPAVLTTEETEQAEQSGFELNAVARNLVASIAEGTSFAVAHGGLQEVFDWYAFGDAVRNMQEAVADVTRIKSQALIERVAYFAMKLSEIGRKVLFRDMSNNRQLAVVGIVLPAETILSLVSPAGASFERLNDECERFTLGVERGMKHLPFSAADRIRRQPNSTQ